MITLLRSHAAVSLGKTRTDLTVGLAAATDVLDRGMFWGWRADWGKFRTEASGGWDCPGNLKASMGEETRGWGRAAPDAVHEDSRPAEPHPRTGAGAPTQAAILASSPREGCTLGCCLSRLLLAPSLPFLHGVAPIKDLHIYSHLYLLLETQTRQSAQERPGG